MSAEALFIGFAVAGWVMLYGLLLIGLFFSIVILAELIKRRGVPK